jgi:hypothetical protein
MKRCVLRSAKLVRITRFSDSGSCNQLGKFRRRFAEHANINKHKKQEDATYSQRLTRSNRTGDTLELVLQNENAVERLEISDCVAVDEPTRNTDACGRKAVSVQIREKEECAGNEFAAF